MIKVEKDFNDIPTILESENRREAFEKNIEVGGFEYGKTLYKPQSVKDKLKEIYHSKCAYCEKNISDESQHIEHYRPKDSYYWLACSWDNLLLCCTRCNSKKGERFKTCKPKVNYSNERFEDIHSLGSGYDYTEEPMIINPEKNDILESIRFNNEGKIFSDDSRVEYTIKEACGLNREELREKRVKLFNAFRHNIEEHYELFKEDGYIRRFFPDIKRFLKECDRVNEFYAFRYFIVHNIEDFFEGKLRTIVKGVLLGLLKQE